MYLNIVGLSASDEVALMSLILSTLGLVINMLIIIGCWKYFKPAALKAVKDAQALAHEKLNSSHKPNTASSSGPIPDNRAAGRGGSAGVGALGLSGISPANGPPKVICSYKSERGPCPDGAKKGSRHCSQHSCPGHGCTKSKSSQKEHCDGCAVKKSPSKGPKASGAKKSKPKEQRPVCKKGQCSSIAEEGARYCSKHLCPGNGSNEDCTTSKLGQDEYCKACIQARPRNPVINNPAYEHNHIDSAPGDYLDVEGTHDGEAEGKRRSVILALLS